MAKAKVFINGELVGTHDNPAELVEELRKMRRQGFISRQVNIALNDSTREVIINSDMGRARRPLLVVENGSPKVTEEHVQKLKNKEISFDDLVKEGCVEYLDAEEEENAYIALYESDITDRHTHMEIDPEMMLGICTGMVPYPEHNASPRNTMGAAMIKQCIGVSTDRKSVV